MTALIFIYRMERGMDILENLEKYAKSDYVPMHMPGGKRNPYFADMLSLKESLSIDITEIDGFDNMHNPEGIIKNAFERAAKLFGAKESLFLVNGSTSGNLAAICGVTDKNDNVIVARNCHCSVYNAITLNELNPIYITPRCDSITGIFDGVTLKDIKEIFKSSGFVNSSDKKIAAVIITSPTYEGNVSQIREIAEYLHKKNIPLIVDEAHGAHFAFHENFPESAVDAGADIVINSLHKTLPVLTQAAIMHLSGSIINYDKVKRYWNMFQTTSPSYILMASIDRCLQILEENGKELFDIYMKRLNLLRKKLNNLKNISLVPTDDISKIILKCDDGIALNDCLKGKYHIQLEMTSFKYIIAMTSVADTDEYYRRFETALSEIDSNISMLNSDKRRMHVPIDKIGHNEMVMKPSDAIDLFEKKGGKLVDILHFQGHTDEICAKQVLIYPPGIPVLFPGEKVTESAVDIINAAVSHGLEVIGLNGKCIECLK